MFKNQFEILLLLPLHKHMNDEDSPGGVAVVIQGHTSGKVPDKVITTIRVCLLANCSLICNPLLFILECFQARVQSSISYFPNENVNSRKEGKNKAEINTETVIICVYIFK